MPGANKRDELRKMCVFKLWDDAESASKDRVPREFFDGSQDARKACFRAMVNVV